ncbi:uncharacterized protein L3040_008908 [Drepanopeziza brunnea f. sp. 'multigermtubi']|uniref:uncharacterized protein n=1 Tax=Drepanopeziza brunnea f. sp. 'multigermtubi' TaxID=698441 RepID=UPI00238311C2|nr:hypothetical protein L3040_008908 [Drepanopeziza brunnea f. sp. 'multigermtubi']
MASKRKAGEMDDAPIEAKRQKILHEPQGYPPGVLPGFDEQLARAQAAPKGSLKRNAEAMGGDSTRAKRQKVSSEPQSGAPGVLANYNGSVVAPSQYLQREIPRAMTDMVPAQNQYDQFGQENYQLYPRQFHPQEQSTYQYQAPLEARKKAPKGVMGGKSQQNFDPRQPVQSMQYPDPDQFNPPMNNQFNLPMDQGYRHPDAHQFNPPMDQGYYHPNAHQFDPPMNQGYHHPNAHQFNPPMDQGYPHPPPNAHQLTYSAYPPIDPALDMYIPTQENSYGSQYVAAEAVQVQQKLNTKTNAITPQIATKKQAYQSQESLQQNSWESPNQRVDPIPQQQKLNAKTDAITPRLAAQKHAQQSQEHSDAALVDKYQLPDKQLQKIRQASQPIKPTQPAQQPALRASSLPNPVDAAARIAPQKPPQPPNSQNLNRSSAQQGARQPPQATQKNPTQNDQEHLPQFAPQSIQPGLNGNVTGTGDVARNAHGQNIGGEKGKHDQRQTRNLRAPDGHDPGRENPDGQIRFENGRQGGQGGQGGQRNQRNQSRAQGSQANQGSQVNQGSQGNQSGNRAQGGNGSHGPNWNQNTQPAALPQVSPEEVMARNNVRQLAAMAHQHHLTDKRVRDPAAMRWNAAMGREGTQFDKNDCLIKLSFQPVNSGTPNAPEPAQVYVDWDLAFYHSPVLAAHYGHEKNNYRDPFNINVRMGPTMHWLQNWFYTNKLFPRPPLSMEPIHDVQSLLVDLWLVAESLGMTRLQNECLHELVRVRAETKIACLDATILLYSYSNEGCILRKYIVQEYAWRFSEEHIKEAGKFYPPEMMVEWILLLTGHLRDKYEGRLAFPNTNEYLLPEWEITYPFTYV